MRVSAKPNPRKKHLHCKIDYLLLDLLENECKRTNIAKSNILAEALANRYNRPLDHDYCLQLTEKETIEIKEVNDKIKEIDELIAQLKQKRVELLKC